MEKFRRADGALELRLLEKSLEEVIKTECQILLRYKNDIEWVSRRKTIIYGVNELFIKHRETFLYDDIITRLDRTTIADADYSHSYIYRGVIFNLYYDDYGMQYIVRFQNEETDKDEEFGLGGDSMFENNIKDDIMYWYDNYFVNDYIERLTSK